MSIESIKQKLRNGEYLNQDDSIEVAKFVKERFPMVAFMVAGKVNTYNGETVEKRKEIAKTVLKFIGG